MGAIEASDALNPISRRTNVTFDHRGGPVFVGPLGARQSVWALGARADKDRPGAADGSLNVGNDLSTCPVWVSGGQVDRFGRTLANDGFRNANFAQDQAGMVLYLVRILAV